MLPALDVQPGSSIGPFRLGADVDRTLVSLRRDNSEFGPVEVTIAESDVVLNLPLRGLRLHFDAHSNRLRVIHVYDTTKLALCYIGQPIGDATHVIEVSRVTEIFGPTYPGDFHPPSSSYWLQYSGLLFVFPVPPDLAPLCCTTRHHLLQQLMECNCAEAADVFVFHATNVPLQSLSHVPPPPLMCRQLIGCLSHSSVPLPGRDHSWRVLGFGDSCDAVKLQLGMPQARSTVSKHSTTTCSAPSVRVLPDYIYHYPSLGLDVTFCGSSNTVHKLLLQPHCPCSVDSHPDQHCVPVNQFKFKFKFKFPAALTSTPQKHIISSSSCAGGIREDAPDSAVSISQQKRAAESEEAQRRACETHRDSSQQKRAAEPKEPQRRACESHQDSSQHKRAAEFKEPQRRACESHQDLSQPRQIGSNGQQQRGIESGGAEIMAREPNDVILASTVQVAGASHPEKNAQKETAMTALGSVLDSALRSTDSLHDGSAVSLADIGQPSVLERGSAENSSERVAKVVSNLLVQDGQQESVNNAVGDEIPKESVTISADVAAGDSLHVRLEDCPVSQPAKDDSAVERPMAKRVVRRTSGKSKADGTAARKRRSKEGDKGLVRTPSASKEVNGEGMVISSAEVQLNNVDFPSAVQREDATTFETRSSSTSGPVEIAALKDVENASVGVALCCNNTDEARSKKWQADAASDSADLQSDSAFKLTYRQHQAQQLGEEPISLCNFEAGSGPASELATEPANIQQQQHLTAVQAYSPAQPDISMLQMPQPSPPGTHSGPPALPPRLLSPPATPYQPTEDSTEQDRRPLSPSTTPSQPTEDLTGHDRGLLDPGRGGTQTVSAVDTQLEAVFKAGKREIVAIEERCISEHPAGFPTASVVGTDDTLTTTRGGDGDGQIRSPTGRPSSGLGKAAGVQCETATAECVSHESFPNLVSAIPSVRPGHMRVQRLGECTTPGERTTPMDSKICGSAAYPSGTSSVGEAVVGCETAAPNEPGKSTKQAEVSTVGQTLGRVCAGEAAVKLPAREQSMAATGGQSEAASGATEMCEGTATQDGKQQQAAQRSTVETSMARQKTAINLEGGEKVPVGKVDCMGAVEPCDALPAVPRRQAPAGSAEATEKVREVKEGIAGDCQTTKSDGEIARRRKAMERLHDEKEGSVAVEGECDAAHVGSTTSVSTGSGSDGHGSHVSGGQASDVSSGQASGVSGGKAADVSGGKSGRSGGGKLLRMYKRKSTGGRIKAVKQLQPRADAERLTSAADVAQGSVSCTATPVPPGTTEKSTKTTVAASHRLPPTPKSPSAHTPCPPPRSPTTSTAPVSPCPQGMDLFDAFDLTPAALRTCNSSRSATPPFSPTSNPTGMPSLCSPTTETATPATVSTAAAVTAAPARTLSTSRPPTIAAATPTTASTAATVTAAPTRTLSTSRPPTVEAATPATVSTVATASDNGSVLSTKPSSTALTERHRKPVRAARKATQHAAQDSIFSDSLTPKEDRSMPVKPVVTRELGDSPESSPVLYEAAVERMTRIGTEPLSRSDSAGSRLLSLGQGLWGHASGLQNEFDALKQNVGQLTNFFTSLPTLLTELAIGGETDDEDEAEEHSGGTWPKTTQPEGAGRPVRHAKDGAFDKGKHPDMQHQEASLDAMTRDRGERERMLHLALARDRGGFCENETSETKEARRVSQRRGEAGGQVAAGRVEQKAGSGSGSDSSGEFLDPHVVPYDAEAARVTASRSSGESQRGRECDRQAYGEVHHGDTCEVNPVEVLGKAQIGGSSDWWLEDPWAWDVQAVHGGQGEDVFEDMVPAPFAAPPSDCLKPMAVVRHHEMDDVESQCLWSSAVVDKLPGICTEAAAEGLVAAPMSDAQWLESANEEATGMVPQHVPADSQLAAAQGEQDAAGCRSAVLQTAAPVCMSDMQTQEGSTVNCQTCVVAAEVKRQLQPVAPMASAVQQCTPDIARDSIAVTELLHPVAIPDASDSGSTQQIEQSKSTAEPDTSGTPSTPGFAKPAAGGSMSDIQASRGSLTEVPMSDSNVAPAMSSQPDSSITLDNGRAGVFSGRPCSDDDLCSMSDRQDCGMSDRQDCPVVAVQVDLGSASDEADVDFDDWHFIDKVVATAPTDLSMFNLDEICCVVAEGGLLPCVNEDYILTEEAPES